jgi:hypothetical protein
MSPPELFYTPQEVASMFRLTATALNSQRKRGIEPGALAVKVGGKYLYPRGLIDYYLSQLAEEAQASLGLDDSVAEDLFKTTPTNTRVLTLPEAAERLGVDASELSTQWENNTYPGALGWRTTPDAEIVFAPRDLDIWTESHAYQSRQDAPSAKPD